MNRRGFLGAFAFLPLVSAVAAEPVEYIAVLDLTPISRVDASDTLRRMQADYWQRLPEPQLTWLR